MSSYCLFFQEKIDEMPAEKLRSILKGVLSKTPGVMFDLMEPDGEKNPPPAADLDWCVCSNCIQMPTLVESVCCGYSPESCVTTWPVSYLLLFRPSIDTLFSCI